MSDTQEKTSIPIPTGDIYSFQSKMSKNVDKKVVKSKYARYLNLLKWISQQIVSDTQEKPSIPKPTGDVYLFQSKMLKKVDKMFGKSNYARYLKC